ncbi:MAG: hypothetical protein ACKVU1_02105 [bacterium]
MRKRRSISSIPRTTSTAEARRSSTTCSKRSSFSASGSTISSPSAARGRPSESFRFAAVLDGSIGALLFDAARAVLDKAGLCARYDLLGVAGADPRASSAHRTAGPTAASASRIGAGRELPRAHDLHFDDAERALVRDADVTILAGVSLSGLPSRADRERITRRPAGGERRDLVWLLRPLEVAIRFQSCRAFPGNPWNRGEGSEIMVLGDGGLGAPNRQSRDDLFSAAWGYAERQGARRVTLLVGATIGAAARDALVEHARAHAARYSAIAFAAADYGAARAGNDAEIFWSERGPHVVVVIGEESDAAFSRAAALVGGEAFVPCARFGEDIAVVEIADARDGVPAGVPAITPVSAALAAKTICDWLGEAGKGARIERAIERAVRDGALECLRAGAECGSAEMAEITEAIVRRI